MYCFVPDGNRIVKLKDLLLINSINTPNPDRKQQVIKIIESIRAGDEIILINMTTNSVYIAVVKLVTNNENDDNSYKIYIHKLRKIGKNKITLMVALPFWLNLIFNFMFTPVQFVLKNNALAFVVILLVLITIVWAMVAIWPHAKVVSFAFVPYLIWVSIATALQLSITLKN